MALLGDELRDSVQQIKAPVSLKSIDEKVDRFEQRLNGKLLPFLGLHGALLTLLYLSSPDSENVEFHTWISSLVLPMALLVCASITVFYYFRERSVEIPGGAAFTAALAIMVAFYTPLPIPDAVYLVLPILPCLLVILLNAKSIISDYEFNTLWLYIPLFFMLDDWLTTLEQFVIVLVLYVPAIYVKFTLQPKSIKLPLGLSLMVFLGFIIKHNTDSNTLISILVVLALVLFVIYSFRIRHQVGSSLRHFLAEAIVVGLWTLLVFLADFDFENALKAWGIGIALYQSICLVFLARRSLSGEPESDEKNAAGNSALRQGWFSERDARLVWLQVASIAILGEWIIEDMLEDTFGIESPALGFLIMVLPFIPLFHRFGAPFLALTTRLMIAGCLLSIANEFQSELETRYTAESATGGPDALRADFLAAWPGELAIPLFAFVTALLACLRFKSSYQVPWWRGLVRPRHMALIRRTGRLVVSNANRIAFVGGFISALAALINWIRYAGSGGGESGDGQRSRELLLLLSHLYAVAITTVFLRYILGCCNRELNPELTVSALNFADGDLVSMVAFCLGGILLYLIGVFSRDYLARFFASAFVVIPLIAMVSSSENELGFLAMVVFICSLALFGFGLLRGIHR